MLNRMKDTLNIPDIMKNVNVVMIPKKGRLSLNNIENQHGILHDIKTSSNGRQSQNINSGIFQQPLIVSYEIINWSLGDQNKVHKQLK